MDVIEVPTEAVALHIRQGGIRLDIMRYHTDNPEINEGYTQNHDDMEYISAEQLDSDADLQHVTQVASYTFNLITKDLHTKGSKA